MTQHTDRDPVQRITVSILLRESELEIIRNITAVYVDRAEDIPF